MAYPDPFLKHYTATFPVLVARDEADEHAGEAPQHAAPATTRRSILYDNVVLESDKLVMAGPYCGQHEWNYACNIELDGRICGSKFLLRAPEGKAPNTGNLSRHLSSFSERCPNHMEANNRFLASSKNSAQDKDGTWFSVFTF